MTGTVSKLSGEESRAYFDTRPRSSQLGACVSQQSSVVPDRKYLEAKMEALEQEFAGKDVPMPSFWFVIV